MPNTEGRARQLSWLYYNQGLEQAAARDLSGATIKLRQSLQLNKRNTQARNLLGLIYYETGEVIAALQEWLTSQHYQAKDNIAAEYISAVQKDQGRLRSMTEAAGVYNKALQNCREGNDDIAAIQLRRIVTRNPHYVRAAQLLALIDIKEGKLGQAQRILRRINRIDRANPDTLRYLHEIEEQAKVTGRSRKELESEEEDAVVHEAAPAKASRFRNTAMFATLFNLLLGLALGVLAVSFLVVPAIRRNVTQTTNTRIVDYTTTIAEQKDRIGNLETQIEESNAVVKQAREQVESSQTEVDSYDGLLKAYNYMQAEEYIRAADEIEKVDATKLSDHAIEIYNAINNTIITSAYDEIAYAANEAHYEERWGDAIRYYEKALAIDDSDSDLWAFLANSYKQSGETQKAIDTYQQIIDRFPNTHRAESAEYEITMLGGTPNSGGSSDEEYSEDEVGEDGASEDEGSEEEYVEEYEEETYEEPSEETYTEETVEEG